MIDFAEERRERRRGEGVGGGGRGLRSGGYGTQSMALEACKDKVGVGVAAPRGRRLPWTGKGFVLPTEKGEGNADGHSWRGAGPAPGSSNS